jgi:SprT protein
MTPIECAKIIKTELRRCAAICKREFDWTEIKLEIQYNVRGTVAGLAWKDRRVRFNILLLMEQTVDDIRMVAAHEFAHIATHRRWRELHKLDSLVNELQFSAAMDNAPRAHGREWRKMMFLFGFHPKRCHHFDVSKHRRRR